MSDATTEITRILEELRAGGAGAQACTDRLFAVLFDELHALATELLRSERDDHTLQPTALVNELYVRLTGGAPVDWNDRRHFIATASRAMRQVLIDHARRRGSAKRGGDWTRITLSDDLGHTSFPDVDLLDLARAIERLEAVDASLGNLVDLRVFAGLTMAEIAEMREVTRRTVQNHWRVARMFLLRELTEAEPP